MSPRLGSVIAVYFVPFAAAAMESYERVSEWLDHRRREGGDVRTRGVGCIGSTD